ISQYTIGTTAEQTAGKMKVNHADLVDVQINTGFTEGTASKEVTFDNVFTGSDIQGEENITSSTVVWNAQGQKAEDGSVSVAMTKNDYRDVTDSSVSSVAGALESAYTNNALFTSLNLSTAKEVTEAMKQLSGAGATTVGRDARVL
ncbi:hypothetical protein QCK34_004562, partial [Enterobacter asburiae]|nr:hypothetical protein [Enterobacter asburiae]